MLAKITLNAIETYMKAQGRSIFDGIVVPELLDVDTLKDAIFYRADEFGAVYTDPDYLNARICAFFSKNYRTFDKWFYALSIDYEPLYNYDRYEEWKDTHKVTTSETKSGSSSGGNTRTDNTTQTNDLTTTNDLTRTDDLKGTNDQTTEGDVSAYNTSNYSHSDKATIDQDTTQSGTVKNTGTVKDTGTVKNTGTVTDSSTGQYSDSTSGTDNKDIEHQAHIYGNIGVTTSSKMLAEFIETNAKFNPYNCIADMFVQDFCIMVY